MKKAKEIKSVKKDNQQTIIEETTEYEELNINLRQPWLQKYRLPF